VIFLLLIVSVFVPIADANSKTYDEAKRNSKRDLKVFFEGKADQVLAILFMVRLLHLRGEWRRKTLETLDASHPCSRMRTRALLTHCSHIIAHTLLTHHRSHIPFCLWLAPPLCSHLPTLLFASSHRLCTGLLSAVQPCFFCAGPIHFASGVLSDLAIQELHLFLPGKWLLRGFIARRGQELDQLRHWAGALSTN
jgi:hypothetical protein